MQLDPNFPVDEVIFSNGFNTSTSSYDQLTGILSLNLVNSGETATAVDAATIQVRIPETTQEGSKLSYEIAEANLSYRTPKEASFVSTFSMEPASVEVKGAFDIVAEPILIGKPAVITVKNSELISGTEVFAIIAGSKEPVLLGKTDEKVLFVSILLPMKLRKLTCMQ